MNLSMMARSSTAILLLLRLGFVDGVSSIIHSFQDFELDLTFSIGLQCSEVGGLSEQVRRTAESLLEDQMEARCGVQPVSLTLNEKACSGASAVKIWDGSMEVTAPTDEGSSLSCAALGSCVKGIMESSEFLSKIKLHYFFIQGVTYEASATCAPTVSPSQSPSELEALTIDSMHPSSVPSQVESMHPSSMPSRVESTHPSTVPSQVESMQPSVTQSMHPSAGPSPAPSTAFPTFGPTSTVFSAPTSLPSQSPSQMPSSQPSTTQAPSVLRTTVQASFENMSLQMGMTELLSDEGLAQVEKALTDSLQDFLEGRRRRTMRRRMEQSFVGGIFLVETIIQIRDQSLETESSSGETSLRLIFDQSIVYIMSNDSTWTPYDILSQSLGDSGVLDQIKTNLVDSGSDFQSLTSVYGLQMGNLIQNGGSTGISDGAGDNEGETSNSATDDSEGQDDTTGNETAPTPQNGDDDDESSDSSSDDNNNNSTIVLAAALAGGALIGVLGMAGRKRVLEKGKESEQEFLFTGGTSTKSSSMARKMVQEQFSTKHLVVEAFLDESVETESSYGDVEV